jgi:DNA replicative helicase MCM subunit Mcm2 (Cdc46/Mcm family)
MIAFKCGQCGEATEVPQSQAGEVEICPKCKTPNWIPSLRPSPDQMLADPINASYRESGRSSIIQAAQAQRVSGTISSSV